MKSVFGRPGSRRGAVLCALAVTLGLFLGGCEQPANGGSYPSQYTITFNSQGGSTVSAITA
jgi:hypothetical protein